VLKPKALHIFHKCSTTELCPQPDLWYFQLLYTWGGCHFNWECGWWNKTWQIGCSTVINSWIPDDGTWLDFRKFVRCLLVSNFS
jgi:hypothetical protein